MSVYAVDKLMAQARQLARDYRRATGKPLGGISNEIAQYDAARLLDLTPVAPGQGGYDALGNNGPRAGKRIQIKGRMVGDAGLRGSRIGQIKPDQDWDSVVLVLLDAEMEASELYEADRGAITAALQDSSRSRRGAMSVARFKAIGRLVWTRADGLIEDDTWTNLP
jgi:hypothetical protein